MSSQKSKKVQFTSQGFEAISKEYEELQSKRPEIVNELTVARDMGDRSENAAYKYARRKLSSADSRLRFLKKIIDNANVIPHTQTNFVDIGSTVTVNNGTQDITFYIVGEHEADPMNKKISFKSPVGRALLQKKVQDEATIYTPSGTITYKIVAIT